MRPELAAAYVDVSPSTFLAKVAPVLPPVHLTDRLKGYMRTDLDQWLLARRAVGEASLPVRNPWDDL